MSGYFRQLPEMAKHQCQELGVCPQINSTCEDCEEATRVEGNSQLITHVRASVCREYSKILGGGDNSWSYHSETAAVPKHTEQVTTTSMIQPPLATPSPFIVKNFWC